MRTSRRRKSSFRVSSNAATSMSCRVRWASAAQRDRVATHAREPYGPHPDQAESYRLQHACALPAGSSPPLVGVWQPTGSTPVSLVMLKTQTVSWDSGSALGDFDQNDGSEKRGGEQNQVVLPSSIAQRHSPNMLHRLWQRLVAKSLAPSETMTSMTPKNNPPCDPLPCQTNKGHYLCDSLGVP